MGGGGWLLGGLSTLATFVVRGQSFIVPLPF